MKKLLTGILAVLLIAGTAQAQTKKENQKQGKEARHGKDGKAMNDLNLTAEQKEQLKSIREAEKKEMEALKNTALTVEQRNVKRKEIHQKYRSQYSAILTPEQKQQMEQKKGDFKGKREKGEFTGMRGNGGFLANSQKLATELNITADQKAKLQNIYADYKNKAQTIRSNNALTNEQKKEQSKSLAQQYMNQAKAVLTAEQVQKLNEMRSTKGKGSKSKRNFKV